MSNPIAFPEIEMPAPTQVAEAVATALDLSKINLSDVALHQFGKWRDKAAESRKTLTGVQHDLSTKSKIDEAKSLRQRLINEPLADARKVSKAVKSKLNAVSSEVGEELTKIEAEYTEIAKLITPQIEAREAELAEEKRIADEKEEKRKADIQARIDVITACAVRARAPEMTSERIQKGIDLVDAITVDDTFAEFKVAAEEAKSATLETMRALAASAKAREEAAALVEAQRIENERVAEALAAKQAELEKAAEELRALQAAQKAEADRLEAAKVQPTEKTEFVSPYPDPIRHSEPERIQAQPEIQQEGQEVQMQDQAPAANAETVQPTAEEVTRENAMNLGEINEFLQVSTVNAEQLKMLGFEHAGRDRRSFLYRNSDLPKICNALSIHFAGLAASFRKAA